MKCSYPHCRQLGEHDLVVEDTKKRYILCLRHEALLHGEDYLGTEEALKRLGLGLRRTERTVGAKVFAAWVSVPLKRASPGDYTAFWNDAAHAGAGADWKARLAANIGTKYAYDGSA